MSKFNYIYSDPSSNTHVDIVDVTGLASITVLIGAFGTAGNGANTAGASTPGGVGGNTSVDYGGIVLTANGGAGGLDDAGPAVPRRASGSAAGSGW